ncbi:MAG: TraM recognition domain-containing protein [Rhodospirillaceae bacterium]|nr:TraM recognition domain-containing protein [Rhodospirillales bacterium]
MQCPVRPNQEARRLQHQRGSHLCLFIDELKFLASDTIVKALATIAGFDAEIITAYQNFGDLLNPDDSRLDGRAVLQAVQVNSQIKLIFGGTDPDTAEYVAEASGTRMKKITRFERTEINRSGGESWARQRMLADQEEALIPINTVLALPRRVAVLLRPKHLAQVVCVSPVPGSRRGQGWYRSDTNLGPTRRRFQPGTVTKRYWKRGDEPGVLRVKARARARPLRGSRP